MWMLFHHRSKTKPVADGETFTQRCPSCDKTAEFHEVEVSQGVGAFFVDLVEDRERAYRCGACGDTFDVADQAPDQSLDLESLPSPEEIEASQKAERQRLAAAAQARREIAERKANQIEDELAAIKRRLGRYPLS